MKIILLLCFIIIWWNDLTTSQILCCATPAPLHTIACNPLQQYNDHAGSRNDMDAYGGPYGDW